MKGRFSILIALLLVASMVLSACGGAAAPAAPPAAEAPATEAAVEAPAADAPAVDAPATEAPAAEAPADANALPRNETLYSNGQQWGPVVGWNPYSNSNNNAMAIAQQDNGALGGCDMGAQAVQRRCVQAEAGRFLDRPAQPGGSKAEGRWRGVRNPFRRTEMARKACACAEPERIAR